MLLIRSILAAFSDLPKPRDDAIGCSDQGYMTLEAQRVQEFFAGKRWQDVSLGVLRGYRGDRTACLTFMSGEGFRYYYPSFLLMCLDDVLDRSELLESTAQKLGFGPRLPERHRQALTSYSVDQKRCIAEWLLLIAGRHQVLCMNDPPDYFDPLRIYDEHWRQYLTS